ncbi:OmpH family outer membrane protein [Flavobacterium sp. SUN046]|uniref:OmpH family outer membrane protein n=1 Tax=Flavobacterium sp. SUN046 TaxID=3002440 RepID=UPI002DBB02CC|nr:OmpH family outer membrane protein [Flavobacterium sp. SUN046]MEC4047809.1 OmpH family outer membrane protein [Flavobacterium sp. SUN046]
MKKYILILIITLTSNYSLMAQGRVVKIGYIDMEYILEKVPDYAEAKNQLEQKAEKWKQEIEVKKNEIATLKEALKAEKVLLTKELLDEREEEIGFLEKELMDYQQKKFGPNGDLVVQKAVLVKPIQDQVFNAVQDIADAKKYDYIFDKSSDLTILFASKRLDISDRVVAVLTRAGKREQMSKKQLKEEAEKERKQDQIDENPEMSERQRLIEERKTARLKMIEDKKLAAEEKKAAADAKRKQLQADALAKKNGTVSDKGSTAENTAPTDSSEVASKPSADSVAAEKRAATEAAKKKSIEDRQKLIDEKKKAAEEKRLKAIADREALKKAKEDAKKGNTEKP